MLTIQLSLIFRNRRNRVLLAVLAALPILVGVAVRVAGVGAGSGTGLLNQVAGNGLFLVFASLALTVPLFLPVAVGAVASDLLARDPPHRPLPHILPRPVGRAPPP